MDIWGPVVIGLAAQTVVLVVAAFKLHGSVMRKLGEFEMKIETLLEQFLRDKAYRQR